MSLDLTLSLKSFTKLTIPDYLEPGTYRLIFANPFPVDIVDESPEKENITLPVPLSDFDVILKQWRYISKTDQWEFIIEVKRSIETQSEYQQAGIAWGYIIAGLAAVVGIGTIALVFVYGEKIIYIPSLAIIAAVALFFYKDIKGLFK